MCGETKSEADFAFADMARGTRQRHCRKCQAAYRRAHYLANREEYIRREVARINRYRIENRVLMLAYLLAHPCVDCGQTNPVTLDFDHRDPSVKRGNIGFIAARKPWHLVLPEIAKCDVGCKLPHATDRKAAELAQDPERADPPGTLAAPPIAHDRGRPTGRSTARHQGLHGMRFGAADHRVSREAQEERHTGD